MTKEFEYRGVKLTLISKSEFGRIIGKRKTALDRWIKEGLILAPSFEDIGNKKNPFGRGEMAVRMYLKHEAIFVRAMVNKHRIGTGVPASEQCRREILDGMRKIRKQVLEGHPDLMTYPLILEFRNYEDCKEYFSSIGSPPGFIEQLYRKGDKILPPEKIIRRKNVAKESKESA